MGIKEIIKKLRVVKVVPEKISIVEGNYLKNQVALIVGGTGGIGYGMARKFLENGCKVVISGTNREKAKVLLETLGENAAFVFMDITNVDSISKAVNKAVSIFGRIDILVNSAGFHEKEKFGDISEATYDRVLDTNLKGMFFVCQEVSNYMIDKGIKGHILNVSSASSSKPAWGPYEISKWGVRGFTLGLADTLIKYGIVVNAIAPGPVATKMIGKENTDDLAMPINPSGRMASVEEIANLAVFMVSSSGNMIIGDTYFISGGSGTIKMHNS